ncbi:MAG: DUF835 domain-containing protein [Thermoplasmataceae archaeon]
MIIVYDRSGGHKKLIEQLMAPTGVQYHIVPSISEEIIKENNPSSLICLIDDKLSDDEQELFSKESRGYLLIILAEKEPELTDKIRYSSEIVILDDSIDETRKNLRKAMSSHLVRNLRKVNDMTIYLAKNGLYPGNVYFTKPSYVDNFISLLYSDKINRNQVLVASRFNLAVEMPEILNEGNFVWVTDSIGAQRNRPVNLTFIIDSIIKRIAEGKALITLIDIFDLLIVYHTFYDVARAFEQVKSVAIEKNSYLIIVLGEGTMDNIQFGQITRYCLEWNPERIQDLKE